MNAVLIWIVFPLAIAVILFLFQRWKQTITLIGTGVALLLAGLAWLYPPDGAMRLGPWIFEITDRFSVHGRQIILTHGDRPILILLYLMAAFWFLGSLAAKVPAHFVPFGMAATAIMVISIFVEPFYYGALLFEVVALLFTVLLSVPGKLPTKGILRFMAFQTLGMVFILLASWLLNQAHVETINQTFLKQALIAMGLGFAFLLGIFPFVTWIPMISSQNNSYLAAFMFNIFLNGAILFGLSFLEQYAWVQEYIDFSVYFQIVGAIMLGVGGLLTAFQRNLGRVMGYVVIVGIGHAFLAFSLGRTGTQTYFALLIVQICALGVWSLSLNIIYSQLHSLDYSSVAGIAYRLPFPVIGIFLANFSLAGLPLLAGFTLYWALGSQLIFQSSLRITIWLLVASIGMLGGGLRSISVLIAREEELPEVEESTNLFKVLLVFGGTFLVIFGMMPHYLLRFVENLSLVFQ